MTFQVRLTREAQEDVRELFDFLLHRELSRPGGGDLSLADKAIAALQSGKTTLSKLLFKGKPYINFENPSIQKDAEENPEAFLKRFVKKRRYFNIIYTILSP